MKKKVLIPVVILVILAIALLVTVAPEKNSDARKIWDQVWLIINFGILVFIGVKFGRKPLMEFLAGHSKEIQDNLDKIDAALEQAKAKFQESQTQLEGITQRIEELGQRAQADGQRAKKRILRQAEERSTQIINDARDRAETEMRRAWHQVKLELVETTILEAERLIKEAIQPQDDNIIISDYLSRLSNQ